jgi:hypothetical protein
MPFLDSRGSVDFRNSSAFVHEYGSGGVRASAEFWLNVLERREIKDLRELGTGVGQRGKMKLPNELACEPRAYVAPFAAAWECAGSA